MQSNIIITQEQQEDTKQADNKYKDGEKNTMEPYNLWQINPGVRINILSNIQKKKSNEYRTNIKDTNMKDWHKYIEKVLMQDINEAMNPCADR